MSRILIVTDAWYPQTNGVVRCLDNVGREIRKRGHDVQYLTPAHFWTVPLPSYPEIRLSLTPFGAVGQAISAMAPDHIHIATEGPLGLQAKLWCADSGLAYTTSYHTRFPEYVAARAPVPASRVTRRRSVRPRIPCAAPHSRCAARRRAIAPGARAHDPLR